MLCPCFTLFGDFRSDAFPFGVFGKGNRFQAFRSQFSNFILQHSQFILTGQSDFPVAADALFAQFIIQSSPFISKTSIALLLSQHDGLLALCQFGLVLFNDLILGCCLFFSPVHGSFAAIEFVFLGFDLALTRIQIGKPLGFGDRLNGVVHLQDSMSVLMVVKAALRSCAISLFGNGSG